MSNEIKQNKELNLFIISTQKNMFITLIDKKTNYLLKTYSFGSFGFKTNQKKNTPFALEKIITSVLFTIINKNYIYINIIFKGTMYLKRKLFLNIILLNLYKHKHIKILSIKDKTSFPYNGCRLKNKPKK
uniref:30S ribosomal protein S11 n=1 Tax=Nephromyces sp. ex Molgula occidentalis TaxID=2544991 RepID=A0A5C1H7B4_9APIC|nr:30S ribosomal protein S11 [Nephromyces sp. ex Molgula occidentalis]